jgi:hypothetical protein
MESYKWENIFGIVKVATLVIAVIFVMYKWNDVKNIFHHEQPTAPQITKIDENAWRIAIKANQEQIADLKKQLEEKDSKILEITKQRNEKIDEIGIIQAKLDQTVTLHQESMHTYLKGSLHDNYFVKIYKKASDGSQFPIAWAMFYPNQPDNNKWKTGTYPVEFTADVIETQKNDGTYNRYVELNAENNQMKETKGNKYPIKLTDVKWAKAELKTKYFSFFNPRLGLSGVFTDEFFAPSLDLSLMSYGKTNVDMDWRFLTVGIGAANTDGDNKIAFSFTPVQWNFGKAVPLINNAFIGPTVGWHDGQSSFGVSVSIPF